VSALGESVALYLDDGDRIGAVSSVVDATGGHLRLVREGALSLAQLRDVTPMLVRATA
jgi:tRNA A37 threonylcarbamoyladenosine synthetase subunit TsaC/SUA5/YrdC